jgi:hypothetical protein
MYGSALWMPSVFFSRQAELDGLISDYIVIQSRKTQ